MNPPRPSHPQRVFSAVQPTGILHLGNYLGALKNFATLQNEYDCLFCVADLHALTLWSDFDQSPAATRATTAAFLACGIDPEKHIIFNQSKIGVHAELAWVFTCAARFGWLYRMTQFKEKTGSKRDQSSAGLFTYPTLMASDILAYRATHVPIGDDQKQHLELTRDIAQKFNHDVGEDFFPQPLPIIPKTSARVMSLRDGTKKMSKSDPSDMSRINLFDSPDQIVKKIKKAKTDPNLIPDGESQLKKRPEADNLIGLIAALKDETKAQTLNRLAGKNFRDVKSELTDLLVAVIRPIGEKMRDYQRHPDEIDRILTNGAQRAQPIAEKNMQTVKKLIGLV